MRRIVVTLTMIALLLTGIALAQQGFTIRGRLGATDQEAQEGYFAVDNQTMIVVKPGSELPRLPALAGGAAGPHHDRAGNGI